MKRLTKILSSAFISLFLSLSGLLGVGIAHAAGSATMYLSPASGSYNIGSTINLDIHVNSTDPVYLARAAITYSSSLSFVGFTPSAAFPTQAAAKGGAGTAEYDGATFSPGTGDQILATVTFTVTQGTGTATVTLSPPDQGNLNDYSASSVQTYSGGDLEVLASTTGGTYILTGGSTGGGSSGGTSGGTPTSKTTSSSKVATNSQTQATNPTSQSSTKLSITSIDVSNLSSNTATVTWQTSAAATSEVDYGVANTYGFTAGSTTPVTSHSVALDSSLLNAGTTYHFVVKGIASDGSAAASEDMTFRTSGVPLTVTVVDQHNKALKGAKVTVDGVTATTDSSGKAILNDLPSGKVKAAITYNGVTTTATLDVGSQPGQTQQVKINVPKSTNWLLPVIVIGGIIALLAIARFMMMKKRERSRHFPDSPGGGTTSGSGGSGAIVSPGGSSTSAPPGPASGPDSIIKPTNKIQ